MSAPGTSVSVHARSATLRVGIVEDQPLFGEMLAGLISGEPGFEVVGRAETVTQARRMFTPGIADVLTMDIELPDGNGVSLGVSLIRAQPQLGVVLLSAYDHMDMLLDMPQDVRGGWSYLSKKSALSRSILFTGLRASAQGKTLLDPDLIGRSRPRTGSVLESLTDRQFQVIQLLAEGYSNAGIAGKLNISEKSVQNHLTAVYSALDLAPDAGYNPRVRATLILLEETQRIG